MSAIVVFEAKTASTPTFLEDQLTLAQMSWFAALNSLEQSLHNQPLICC